MKLNEYVLTCNIKVVAVNYQTKILSLILVNYAIVFKLERFIISNVKYDKKIKINVTGGPMYYVYIKLLAPREY